MHNSAPSFSVISTLINGNKGHRKLSDCFVIVWTTQTPFFLFCIHNKKKTKNTHKQENTLPDFQKSRTLICIYCIIMLTPFSIHKFFLKWHPSHFFSNSCWAWKSRKIRSSFFMDTKSMQFIQIQIAMAYLLSQKEDGITTGFSQFRHRIQNKWTSFLKSTEKLKRWINIWKLAKQFDYILVTVEEWFCRETLLVHNAHLWFYSCHQVFMEQTVTKYFHNQFLTVSIYDFEHQSQLFTHAHKNKHHVLHCIRD